jgi:transcriptional coactivator HFI1/ADA1
LNIATETYIKEALMSLLGKIILQSSKAGGNKKQHLLCMEDLKLALMLGDGYLGQTPLIAGAIANSRCLDTIGIEDVERERHEAAVNGIGQKKGGEVWNVRLEGDAMVLDGDEGWVGGDAGGLDEVLDEVLEFADL